MRRSNKYTLMEVNNKYIRFDWAVKRMLRDKANFAVFTGVHTHDRLEVNTKEADELRMRVPEDIFPEYYIIRVNEFNSVATTPIEEWLDYLKNNRIKDDTLTPSLKEARQKLLYMTMSDKERRAYDKHMDDIMVQNDVLDTAKREGRAEGEQSKAIDIAKNLKSMGLSISDIMKATGLSEDDINRSRHPHPA